MLRTVCQRDSSRDIVSKSQRRFSRRGKELHRIVRMQYLRYMFAIDVLCHFSFFFEV